jgi:gliding motility-associated lipoprotein GldH
MVHRSDLLIIIFIILALLSSCDQNQVFDEVVAVPPEGWSESDTLSFNVAITDTSAIYDVLLHIRNEKTYAYSNLWLFVETTAPNGQTIHDTLEVILADDEGEWLGRGIGNVNTLLLPYITQVKFKYRGIYTFSIIQGMRDTMLENVLNIGLRIDYSK